LKLPQNWAEMSGNASKVYTWLVANAGRRGTVENDFAKIARANGLSYSTLRRAIKELASWNIVATTPANQHQGTVIKVQVGNSALSTDERSNHPAAALTDERSGNQPAVSTDERSKSSNCLETKEQRAERLAAEIADGGHVAGELTDVQQKALEHLGFQCDYQHLSPGFIAAFTVLYDMHGETLSPGMFARRIITICLDEQNAVGAEGKDPARYSWPPGFRSWRGVLRNRERAEKHAVAV
jgi:hypothetical protein